MAAGDLVEVLAEQVHQAWVSTKRKHGVFSRPSADGEEQMVPYGQLSEPLKELDRATVRAVLGALSEAGCTVVESSCVYIAYGYQGEDILGVFADHEAAVQAAQADASGIGETPEDVATIGTPQCGLDGWAIEEYELQGTLLEEGR